MSQQILVDTILAGRLGVCSITNEIGTRPQLEPQVTSLEQRYIN